MLSPRFRSAALPCLLIVGALAASLAGCGGGSGGSGDIGLVMGDTQSVNGKNVTAWSRIAPDNTVQEVGATVPLSVFQNPPTSGTGPAGAIAVVSFPARTQATTFFNHLEIHWNPNGHPPAFTMVPHFDLHFYGVPVSDVRAVTAPDPVDPAADHVPANYVYPPASDVVPEMGRHAHDPNDYQGTFTTKVNVAGFYNGQLTFVEPTVTQAYLEQKVNFTLSVPRPAVLGRTTRYPTTFTATYDAATDSYTFVYSGFTSIQ